MNTSAAYGPKFRPIYCYQDGRNRVYDKSLKKLSRHIRPIVDVAGVRFYLKHGHFPSCNMVFRGVKKLLAPASSVDSEMNFVKVSDEIACKAELGNRLLRALSGQGEKNATVLFTGGVDSALIAGLLKSIGRSVSSVCAGFSGHSNVIFKDVAKTASSLGLKHQNISISFRNIVSAWPSVIKIADEPIFDLDLCAVYSLLEKLGENSRLLYSGMGCDALFLLKRATESLQSFNEKSTAEVRLHKYLCTATGNKKIYFPYLDDDVVSYIYSLPGRFKKKTGSDKYILRSLAEDFVGTQIANKKSQSTNFPHSWVKGLAASLMKVSFRRSFKSHILSLRAAFLAGWLKELKISSGVEIPDAVYDKIHLFGFHQ